MVHEEQLMRFGAGDVRFRNSVMFCLLYHVWFGVSKSLRLRWDDYCPDTRVLAGVRVSESVAMHLECWRSTLERLTGSVPDGAWPILSTYSACRIRGIHRQEVNRITRAACDLTPTELIQAGKLAAGVMSRGGSRSRKRLRREVLLGFAASQ